jgi:hypothetical protein
LEIAIIRGGGCIIIDLYINPTYKFLWAGHQKNSNFHGKRQVFLGANMHLQGGNGDKYQFAVKNVDVAIPGIYSVVNILLY